jgi:uncharacterized protein
MSSVRAISEVVKRFLNVVCSTQTIVETIREEISMQTQKGHGRGFASMTAEKKREIASKGGKAAHALGTAHKWTSEEAQAAGRKGGSISRRRSKYSIQA